MEPADAAAAAKARLFIELFNTHFTSNMFGEGLHVLSRAAELAEQWLMGNQLVTGAAGEFLPIPSPLPPPHTRLTAPLTCPVLHPLHEQPTGLYRTETKEQVEEARAKLAAGIKVRVAAVGATAGHVWEGSTVAPHASARQPQGVGPQEQRQVTPWPRLLPLPQVLDSTLRLHGSEEGGNYFLGAFYSVAEVCG